MTVQTPSSTPPTTPPPSTPTPSPQGNPGGFFGTFGPWMVGAAAAAAVIMGGAVLLNNDGEDTTVVADQPTTSVTAELDAETTLTTNPAAESTVTTGPVTTVTGTDTTEAGKDTTTVPSTATCSATGYSVTVPAGWFHDGCAVFSPAAIPAPGPFEFRPEIDLSYTTSETYTQALARIDATMTVLWTGDNMVDGLNATVFTIEEEWFETGERTVYVVDAGTGVFFASGNELIDSGATVTDLDAHYADTLIALNDMMATANIAYTAAPKQPPACGAPSLSNPSTGPSIQADVDGDGQPDTVDLVHHDNGVSIVVDAGTVGYYVGNFATSQPPHVSNQLVAVDLDGNGTMEILGSAESGAAGNSYQTFFVSGCNMAQAGGDAPLVQRASASNVATFECSFGAHGKVELDTMSSVYDDATGQFENEAIAFEFNGTSWVQVGSWTSTTPSPIGLAGPNSCG